MFGDFDQRVPQVLDFATKRVRNFLSPANGGFSAVTAGGTADALTVNFSPAVVPFVGMLMAVVLSAANVTTTPTISTNGGTARTITKKGGSAVAAGDLPGAAAVALFEFSAANTWELMNAPSVSKVACFQTTDSTNISLSIAPTQANIGTAFAATIPAKGLIDLGLIATYNASASTSNGIILGIRISGTNYFPVSNDGGTSLTNNTPENSGVDRTVTAWGKSPSFPKGDNMVTLDIQNMAIPTGAQTIQPIAAYNGGAGTWTIKGTVTVSKFYTRIYDHT